MRISDWSSTCALPICDALIAPSESFAQVLRDQRMNYDIGIWTRGVEQGVFNPGRRDMAWRRSLGIDDDVPAIAFLGRLVMEKGLDVFADAIDVLGRRGVPHRSEEHTSELQSLMRISSAVFCLKNTKSERLSRLPKTITL